MTTQEEALECGVENYVAEGDNATFSAEGQEEAESVEQHLHCVGRDDKEEGEGGDGDDDEDPDEDELEEVDDGDTLTQIQEAKSMVHLYVKMSRNKKGSTSPAWGVCKLVRMSNLNLLEDLERLDSAAHKKLDDANREGKELCICEICFANATTWLHNCIITPSYKKGKTGGFEIEGTGNLLKHLDRRHKGWVDSLNKQRSNRSVRESASNSTPGKSNNSVARSRTPMSEATGSPGIVGDASLLSPPSSFVFNEFSDFSQKGESTTVNQLHFLIHKFATNNNIAERAVARPSDCPEFKEMLEFAITNGRRSGNAVRALQRTCSRPVQGHWKGDQGKGNEPTHQGDSLSLL